MNLTEMIEAARKAQDAVKAESGKGKTANKVVSVDVGTMDNVTMPEDKHQRRAFNTLLTLSAIGMAERGSAVIPHFALVKELQGVDLGEPVGDVMDRIKLSGLVRRIVSKKGALCWIPTVLDQPKDTVKGARSSKGGRTSEISRMVDQMEEQYNKRTA